jgi:hypothetical protein
MNSVSKNFISAGESSLFERSRIFSASDELSFIGPAVSNLESRVYFVVRKFLASTLSNPPIA